MPHSKQIGNSSKNESRGLSFKTISVKTPKRKPHAHHAGDVVVVKAGAGCKHGSNPYLDPMRITQVNDNGTIKLVKVADNNGGAVSQTWNIRNVEPRMA